MRQTNEQTENKKSKFAFTQNDTQTDSHTHTHTAHRTSGVRPAANKRHALLCCRFTFHSIRQVKLTVRKFLTTLKWHNKATSSNLGIVIVGSTWNCNANKEPHDRSQIPSKANFPTHYFDNGALIITDPSNVA